MIAWKQASDSDDQGDCRREVSERGDGEQPVDAERLFPEATEERGKAGHDGTEKVEHAHGSGTGV
jgi:hypothetical protein